MAQFTPQMLRDLLASPDPKDQELAQQLSALEFSNENGRLANYPPPPAAPDQSSLNSKYIQGSIGPGGSGGMAVQDMPFPAPPQAAPAPQPPAPPPELMPNQFRNERTGKTTTLSPPPTAGGALPGVGGAPQEQILGQLQQKDGSIFQIVRVPTDTGWKETTRVVTPPGRGAFDLKDAQFQKLQADMAAATPEGRAAITKAEEKAKFDVGRENLARMSPAERQAQAAKRAGVTLKPGEQFDEATGTVTPLPGSATYQKQQDSITAARDQRDTFNRHAEAYVKNIDMLIGDPAKKIPEHPGLRGAIGMIDARLPGFTPAQTDAQRLAEGLLNKASVEGLQDLRKSGTAPGSITEKEWPIFQSQGEIMAATQSEDQYRQALRDKRAQIIEARDRVNQNFAERQAQYGNKSTAPVQTSTQPREVSFQDILAAAKKTGKDPLQVRKDAMAKGYVVKGM